VDDDPLNSSKELQGKELRNENPPKFDAESNWT
jgi:hypothetical protein